MTKDSKKHGSSKDSVSPAVRIFYLFETLTVDLLFLVQSNFCGWGKLVSCLGNILLLKPWHILILVLIHNDFLIQSGPFIFRAPEMHN